MTNARRSTGWLLYCVVAQEQPKIAYFKIGISQSIVKRVHAIKVGCPLPIVEVHTLNAFTYKNAIAFEAYMHGMLYPYRTEGEWFKFDLADPEHKKAFNDTARSLITSELGAAGKWRRLDVADFFQKRNAAKRVAQQLREIISKAELDNTTELVQDRVALHKPSVSVFTKGTDVLLKEVRRRRKVY